MTTILEFLGHCVLAIIYILMKGFTEFISLALFMLLHFVVLSYVYLMNTEFNKNRILTQGWKNVLRNITPFCNKNNSNSVDNQSTPECNSRHRKDDDLAVSTQKTTSFELTNITNTTDLNKNVYVNQSTLESNSHHRKNDDLAVSTQKHPCFELTTITNTTDLNKNVLNETLQSEVDQQTCSGTIKNNNENSAEQTFQRQDNETSIIHVRIKLLSDLLSRIDDEDRYISTFMKFVELEESIKTGKSVKNLDEPVDEHTPKLLPHFVGSVRRKFEKRNAILKKLLCCVNEYDIYEERLEQFISMEETFLEDGC